MRRRSAAHSSPAGSSAPPPAAAPLLARTSFLERNEKNNAHRSSLTARSLALCRYDIEDAIVLNRASVDRGFGRVSIYRKYTTAVRNHRNHTTDILATPPRRDDPLHAHFDDARWAQKSQRYRALGRDGLAEVGAMVSAGDVLVNRRTPTDTSGDMLGSTSSSAGTLRDTKPLAFTGSPEVYREAYSGYVLHFFCLDSVVLHILLFAHLFFCLLIYSFVPGASTRS